MIIAISYKNVDVTNVINNNVINKIMFHVVMWLEVNYGYYNNYKMGQENCPAL